MINLLKKFSIIIFVLLALIVSRMGVSYIIILIAIGLIVSFINQRKREAVITGVLYALVSYILSYPAGLFLSEYMPTTNVVIETSAITVAKNLIVGALIPMIIAFILCGITAIIGSNIAKAMNKDKSSEEDDEGYHFSRDNSNSDNNPNNDYQQDVEYKNEDFQKNRKKFSKLTPIDKAKMKKQQGENDD